MILPVIHQQVRSPTDTPTAFHMSVVQTTTNTFTLLVVEHSRDTSWPTHDFDLEGVLLVEGPEGLEGMGKAFLKETPLALPLEVRIFVGIE